MEVTFEIYTWLKKTNILSCNYSNPSNKILLSEEDSLKLELGLISPLIQLAYQGSLPSNSELNLSNSSSSRLYNWNLLLKPLESIGVHVSSDTKALIVAGDRMQVIGILSELISAIEKKSKKPKKLAKTLDGGLLLGNIDVSSDLSESESVLEFLILSFCKAFHIAPKVSAGLLAQKCTYLSQLLIKGLKGDYEAVVSWYQLIIENASAAYKLIESEQSSVQLFLSCMKPGLLSRDPRIPLIAVETCIAYHTQLKYLHPLIWDWFSNQSNTALTCFEILGSRPEISETVVRLLYTFGKKNLHEVFYTKLREYCHKNQKVYLKIIGLCLQFVSQSQISQHFFNQGLVELWADMGLREFDAEIKDLEHKAFCAGFLCDLWGSFPNYIEIRDELATSMLNVIKKSTRDSSRLLKFIIYGRLFHLLSVFSNQRNSFAPVIYKTLTFCLVENYSDEKIREFMLWNMTMIFQEVSSIPLGIMLEPFIKQSQIAKNVNYEIFDFDFFLGIAKHERLSIKDSVILLDLLGKIILNDASYGFASVLSFVIIVDRFLNTLPVREFLNKFLKIGIKLVCLGLKNASPNVRSVKKSVNYILEKIIGYENHEVNSNLRYIFEQCYNEIKKVNDKKLLEICSTLGVPNAITENSVGGGERSYLSERVSERISERNLVEESIRVASINTIPKGRVMNDLEKVKKKRIEKETKEKEEIDKKLNMEIFQKKVLRKQIEKRRIELGIKSKAEDEGNVLISEATDKESIIQLNRIHEESQQDQELIEIISKKYSRVAKLLFSSYAGTSYKHKNAPLSTFDVIQDTKSNLSESDFCRLIRENGLNQYMISTDEVKQVFRFLAVKVRSPVIHYEDFLDLLYLTSGLTYSRSPIDLSKYPPAFCLEALFECFKSAEDQTIPRYLFEEPDPGCGDRDIARLLNQQLDRNPEINLPEGYRRVKEPLLCVEFNAELENNLALKHSVEILDEILFNCLGVHLLMPVTRIGFRYRARGIATDEYKASSVKQIVRIESTPGFAKLSPAIKLSAIGIPYVSNEEIVECGKVLDDVLYSLEKGSGSLISKHPKPPGTINNKAVTEKIISERVREEEIERAEYKRKLRKQELDKEVNKYREQKEYKMHLEKEEKKKALLREKFAEKKVKERKEKEKFEIEEKILEYKLEKAGKELKSKEKLGEKPKNMWNIRHSQNKMNISIDFNRPKSNDVSPQKKNVRTKSVSIPFILKKHK